MAGYPNLGEQVAEYAAASQFQFDRAAAIMAKDTDPLQQAPRDREYVRVYNRIREDQARRILAAKKAAKGSPLGRALFKRMRMSIRRQASMSGIDRRTLSKIVRKVKRDEERQAEKSHGIDLAR